MMQRGSRFLSAILQALGRNVRRWAERFYLLLAAAIAVLLLVDYSLQGWIRPGARVVEDRLIRWRLSSPPPSADILIVDIDERTMARLEPEYGRWPWSRAVIAEALASIGEAAPAAVLVNLHTSERDLRNPAGDEALVQVAEAYPQLVFSFVRLPAANDAQSELPTALLPGAIKVDGATSATETVAVVLPAYASLQRRMGASNLRAEYDGIVRRYPYWHAAGAYLLPSTVAVAAGLAGNAVEPRLRDRELINWRNKRGDYTRISFADLYADLRGGERFDWRRFSGKIVVLGITAPGIAPLKGTPLSPLTDDNLILATALDDALNDTALHMTPRWLGLLLALLMLAALARAFMRRVDQAHIDRAFVIAQVILVVVTVVSISYANFVVDLTLALSAGVAYFAIAKVYYGAQHASERGAVQFWDTSQVDRADEAVIIVLQQATADQRPVTTRIRRELTREIGFDAVLHLDHLVDAQTFLGIELSEIELLVAFLPRGSTVDALRAVQLARDHGHEVRLVELAGLDAQQSRARIWREVLLAVFPDYLGKAEQTA